MENSLLKKDYLIGGVSVKSLVKDYGTPLYVFDEKKIEDIISAYNSALEKYYGKGNSLICYASKAFCCKRIYNLIDKFNIGADCVSGGELYTIKSANFGLNKVVFHGNNKSEKELIEAISSNIYLIVVDSLTEADEINELASKLNKKQNVLIRVNPSIEAHTHHYIQTSKIDSKFGFSIDNGDALNAINYVKNKENINLLGLHCHIGSQIFEKKSFILAVHKMTDFYKKLKEEFSVEFDVLNLGGGFGIKYNDADPDFTPEDYADYVKEICLALNSDIKAKNIKKPFLILEPGRSIVGEAGSTLYTAGNIKEIKGIKNYIAIDGGMFENPRFALYQAKYKVIAPLKLDEKAEIKYSIAGKCCESGDLIAEDIVLPKIEKGDILMVLSTGAYNYSMASNYNRNLIPPVVFVKDGKSSLAIKGQTFEDLIKNDL